VSQVVREKWSHQHVHRWARELLGFSEETSRLLPWRGRFLADAEADQVPHAMTAVAPLAADMLRQVLTTKNWGHV
jgi:hypothetical protein